MENCVICYEPLEKDVVVTYCDHIFHKACILKWSTSCRDNHIKTSCPVCRYSRIIIGHNLSLKEYRKQYMEARIQLNLTRRQLEETEAENEYYAEENEELKVVLKDAEDTIKQLLDKITQLTTDNK